MSSEVDGRAVCTAPPHGEPTRPSSSSSPLSSSLPCVPLPCNAQSTVTHATAFEHSLQSFLQRLYAQQYQVHRAFSSLIERVEKTTRAFSTTTTSSEAHSKKTSSLGDKEDSSCHVASLISSVKATETLYCFLFDRVLVHQLDADMSFFKDVQSYMDSTVIQDTPIGNEANGEEEDDDSARQEIFAVLDAARRAPFAVHRRQARYLAELPVLHGTMPYARLPNFSQREAPNTNTINSSGIQQPQRAKVSGDIAVNEGEQQQQEEEVDNGEDENSRSSGSGGALTPSSEEASSPCVQMPSQSTTIVRKSNEDTARLLRTMQRVFAISGHYPPAVQYDILHTVTHVLRLAAVLLPAAVADEDHLAGLLNCAFLVTPQSPATAQPRVVYVRKESLDLFVRQRRRTGSTTTETSRAASVTNDNKSNVQLSVSDVNRRGLNTSKAATTTTTNNSEEADRNNNNGVRVEEESVAECDDAELEDLLEQLDKALTRPLSPPQAESNTPQGDHYQRTSNNNDTLHRSECTSAGTPLQHYAAEGGQYTRSALRATAQRPRRLRRALNDHESGLVLDKTPTGNSSAQTPSRKRARVAERASWAATLSANKGHRKADPLYSVEKPISTTTTTTTTPPLTFTQVPIESQLIRYEHAEERDSVGQALILNSSSKSAADGPSMKETHEESSVTDESTAWVFQISHSLKDIKAALIAAIQQLGAKVNTSAKYDPKTTHLVLMEGMADRTEKYLSCCAAGKRIVPPRFVFDSVARGHWLQSRIAEYDMNPRHRFARCLPCPALHPFSAWRVVLFTSNAFIAAGIRTVLRAGGCTTIYSYLADNPNSSSSRSKGGPAETYRATTDECGVHEEGKDNSNNMDSISETVSLLTTRMQQCTHILVECTVMSPAPNAHFFALPVWYPRLCMQDEFYTRTFTLELLYYCLCTSAAPVFDDATGGLIAEDRLIPACRVAPFTQNS